MRLRQILKFSYTTAGIAIILIGMVISAEAPILSQIFLTKTVILEIPRKEFRIQVERIFQGDMLSFDFDVQGGKRDLYITIERTHFYIGPRQEFGAPARIFTSTVLHPSLIIGSESLKYTSDLEGHLNIFFNNTKSTEPKTVTYTMVFEKSSNMKYATGILRNLCILAGGILLLLGIVENYEEKRYLQKIARVKEQT
jgi:hypothetical protein